MSILRYATRLLRWSRVLFYARQVEDDNGRAQGIFQINLGRRKGSTTETGPPTNGKHYTWVEPFAYEKWREYNRRLLVRDQYDVAFQFRDWDEVTRLRDDNPWLR